MLPRIPLIEDLTKETIPVGSNILVEFDPTSQWYNASFTLGAGWLKTGGSVAYNTFAQPPENVRNRFKQLGFDDVGVENAERLRIIDWYTASLGQKSKEKIAIPSLKVADLSIDFMKNQLTGPPIPDRIRITDNGSVHARFNEEKPWVEFLLTRGLQIAQTRKSTAITGLMTGVHSEWVYRQMEGAHDVVIDFKLQEASNGETIDVMRIRNARSVMFTKGWHRLKIGQNLEVTLEK